MLPDAAGLIPMSVLKQSRFTSTISAKQSKNLTLMNVKTNITDNMAFAIKGVHRFTT
jgi:hypothetical protein